MIRCLEKPAEVLVEVRENFYFFRKKVKFGKEQKED